MDNIQEKNHKFLVEELMVPNCKRSDTQRINMFSLHLNQILIPDNPDIPRVFTNFENQIGRYSSGYKVLEKDIQIIDKVKKNKYNSIFIHKDKDNYYDIFERKEAVNITEHYGFRCVNHVDDLEQGDEVVENSLLMRNTSYDDELNLMYGKNLKALYTSFKDLTFEDAICICESKAKEFTTNYVNIIYVSINTNDILINLYGNETEYKTFPDIGDKIENGILCARRRTDHDMALYTLSNEKLMKVDPNIDTCFYSHGKVVDIEVFSNTDLESIEKYSYSKQIGRYLKSDLAAYRQLKLTLDPIIEGEEKYSDDIAFLYNRITNTLDPEVKYTHDGRQFSHLLLKFTILESRELRIGDKLSNR